MGRVRIITCAIFIISVIDIHCLNAHNAYRMLYNEIIRTRTLLNVGLNQICQLLMVPNVEKFEFKICLNLGSIVIVAMIVNLSYAVCLVLKVEQFHFKMHWV